ncbi:MAG: ABC transporter permease subunit [Bacilli bacterium]|nr:ABC transporter permease subunit [Bacilli bacterium]
MNLENLFKAFVDTLLMTGISTILAYIIGLPVGVLLNVTSKKGIRPNKVINSILGTIVNVLRSIPCLLLIIILIPLSNVILGKGEWSGHWYSMIIPLVFTSFAFVARMVEQALNEVDAGEVEAIKSLGASNWQLITKVIIPESRTSLISGFAVTIVSIIGYTSFAGYIAAGGLIVEAFNLGYYGTDKLGMWICVIFVVVIVQVLQEAGLAIAKKVDKRRVLK